MKRVLDVAEERTEDDLKQATIPVLSPCPGDESDQALRRYAKDWIRKQGRYSVEAKFHKFKPSERIAWKYDDGTEDLLYGAIVLTWWDRPELTADERQELEWRRSQEEKKRRFSD